MVNEVIDPDESFVFGGSWRIPVMEGLLQKDFISNLKLDGTYNDASFSREFESQWSGEGENAFFSAEKIDNHRTINLPEYKASGKSNKEAYYVIGVDVGRKGCTTEAVVIKVSPTNGGTSSIKSVVNLESWDEKHFETQAINIKKLYYAYNAQRIIIDGNGLGIGLIDYMVKSQTDPDTGEVYPDFGVYNDEENFYKQYKTKDTETDAVYIVKANATINTIAHTNVQTNLYGGRLKFLIDEKEAKIRLLSTAAGQRMSSRKRAAYLKPFTLTTILREEMLNLYEENEGQNIILKQSSKGIKKDKFSALEYGLYYVRIEEDKKKKRKGRGSLMFFSKT